jgi:hypothetical protein
MKYVVLTAALLFAAPAAAQQQTTLEQRIGAQIGAIIIQNAALQEQIEKLQAQIKALQDKNEPKPNPPK